MSKFRNKDNKGTPAISLRLTHSFYVAFFMETVMRETTLFVEVMIPKAPR